jgi:hypothetical protein
MAKKSLYWEGWGFNDRIPMYFSATKRNIEKLISELRKTYPENPVEQVNPRILQVMANDNEIKSMKRIASVFNAKLSYAEGGGLEGISIADANPYIAGAKTAKQIAPKSVDALDARLASKINPDPNRPIFFSHGGGVKNKSFVVFFKSNLLDNIVYTNVDSDSLEKAIKTQKLAYKWSEIQWIKGFEQKDANHLQEFFLQNIKQKWENKSGLLVKIKDDKIIFSRNDDSIDFYFIPMFEIKENVRVFKEAYLTNGNVEIYVDSDFNFDRNKIFQLILEKMEKGGVAPTIGGTMETSMTDAPMIGGTMASSLFAEGGTTDDTTIAKVILEQLGGINKLVVMTGAYNFVKLPDGVYFKIKNRKVNYVKIRLNEKDLYDVIFGKIISGKVKTQSEHYDIYFDELKPVFETSTGMYLNF